MPRELTETMSLLLGFPLVEQHCKACLIIHLSVSASNWQTRNVKLMGTVNKTRVIGTVPKVLYAFDKCCIVKSRVA